jgi:hypothetical protein
MVCSHHARDMLTLNNVNKLQFKIAQGYCSIDLQRARRRHFHRPTMGQEQGLLASGLKIFLNWPAFILT